MSAPMSEAEYWGTWGRLANPITPLPPIPAPGKTSGLPCYSHDCGWRSRTGFVCPCGNYPACKIPSRKQVRP